MHNAKGIAVKIQARLGAEIRRACFGSLVPEHYLAGVISVENDRLDIHASRFEKPVYEKLKKLRNPLVFWRRSWNGITQADLQGKTDAQLADLATSFGYTQIMGWWSIALKCRVDDIRRPDKHLQIAVQLLTKVATPQIIRRRFDQVLRIWNTGQPDGKTFDSQYVPHATAVADEYLKLRVSPPRSTTNAPSVSPSPGSPPALSPSSNQSAADI